jgi:ADP-heptose:LPS heptosyltransferase
MGKRDAIEIFISKLCSPPKWGRIGTGEGLRILVLRNNDIGDLILTTPLFQALKVLYPGASVEIGIGDWNKGLLDRNPYVDKVVPFNAPWHNKVSCKHSPNSPLGFIKSMIYIFFSAEARELGIQRYGLGIDVLGSQEGGVLMHRCSIPRRMGARGYGGGHTACQTFREFKIDQSVSMSVLEYPSLLGMPPAKLPSPKPQIFLSKDELKSGLQKWGGASKQKRIVISTGAGFREKCWPEESYSEVVVGLASDKGNVLAFVGSERDNRTGEHLRRSSPSLLNFAGKTSLRETFALIYHADVVICNSTMFMHVAAAFDIPNLVLLGPWYESAKLHMQQWGHPNTIIIGREISEGKHELATPLEVLQLAREIPRRTVS